MKPILLIGLGNALMGDDGIGWRVAQAIEADRRLADMVEVIPGGTDLLRYSDRMQGRRRVVIVDAIACGEPAGTVLVFDQALPDDTARRHGHDLSVVDAIELLRHFQGVPITLIAVSIESVEAKAGLSPALAGSLPSILDQVIEHCR